MLYIIYITVATVAGGVLLTLISDAFAYEMSRVFETALDGIEYRRALRAKQRGAARRRERAVRVGYEVSYPAQARVSL